MTSISRSEFLKVGAVVAGSALFGRHAAEPALFSDPIGGGTHDLAPSAADLVVLDARVYTIDDAQPVAEAFAVRDGRFLAVGRSADMRGYVGKGTEVIRAAGKAVTPGFIDAHCHPAWSGLEAVMRVDLNLTTIAAIEQALRDRVSKTPPGAWVMAFKYDDTKVKDGKVDRALLDRVAPNNPVWVDRRGGHIAWFNSQAFALAGITRQTADPSGGAFGRDANGEMDGRVAENAVELVGQELETREKGPPDPTPEQWRDGVTWVMRAMTAAGITSVHDAGIDAAMLRGFQDARAIGELRARVSALTTPELYATLTAAGIHSGFGDEWIRIIALKLFADGSVSARTMRMSTPYEGRPKDYGILTISPEELDRRVDDALGKGFRVGVHANGDVAISMVLDAYEKGLAKHPNKDSRLRIEHCTLINPEILKRMAAIGAVPTPFATYLRAYGEKWPLYGEEKLRSMFAHRSFLDAGIRVAGATDYEAGPFEPLMAIQSMVTRKDLSGKVWGGNQRVSVDEALKIYTLNGAYASMEEGIKGSIAPRKLADFVILGADPHRVDPDAIEKIVVERTVTGGRTVHPIAS